MSNDDLAASLGRLIERIDLYESVEGDAMECLIPLDESPFVDEDIDIKVFMGELRLAMEQLGVTVSEVSLVDETGNEHPLPLPPRRPSFWYLLDEQGQPVPTNDIGAVARLLGNAKARTVAKTSFVAYGKHVDISTVFLVLNHAHLSGSEPVLWESMVFTNFQRLHEMQMRYTSAEEAKAGHRWLVTYTKRFLGADRWSRRRRKPTIHQAVALFRRQRLAQRRKRGGR
jgi:hypothetical protein